MGVMNADANLRDLANRYEANLSVRPIEEQIAVGLISKNVLNGCSWEFVRGNAEIKNYLDNFKNSKVCSIQEVTYDHRSKLTGYLVYMVADHLHYLLGPKFGGPLNIKDLEIASKHREEASIALAKRMQKGYTGVIGIFCTNDSQSITIEGTTYPAYAITLKELCVLCAKFGYGLKLAGRVVDANSVLAREDAVIKNSVVAPSSNALFVNIQRLG